MQHTKLMAALIVGATVAATTLIAAPANASRQGDQMTMLAAQYMAQNQQAAYQAQLLAQQQQLAAQQAAYANPAYTYQTYAYPAYGNSYRNVRHHWHHW